MNGFILPLSLPTKSNPYTSMEIWFKQFPHSGPLGIRTAFRIGRDYEGRIQYWNGAMDDFRIYGRGLNQYEVEDLFSDMSDMVDLDAGLVAHYPFSGNAEDHSDNGHHLP